MSTLATADLSSDSENDADFVPTSPKRKAKSRANAEGGQRKAKRARLTKGAEEGESDSPSSSSSDSDSKTENDEGNERAKNHSAAASAAAAAEERKRKAREEFERMKAELNGTSTSASEGKSGEKQKHVEKVEVKRARRFAGETIYETVKLRKDDPEAIAYLAKQHEGASEESSEQGPSATGPSIANSKREQDQAQLDTKDNDSHNLSLAPETQDTPLSSTESTTSNLKSIAPNPTSTSTPTPTPAPAPASTVGPSKPKGPPVRRKPRQSLEAMSAALDKGKKMTTLEKSQMDWKSHTTSTAGLHDELSLNRKNGGYLDKKDFLDRVGERRSGAFDSKR
ncbi:uncharacterized protein I303_102519 [Kwoniella dejecticola CBS 10117]|uniref:SWR1-complex protein 5 n=1 Tax=Kwoniella dejecticola CBS 10117 TaxID=1296121 RepID=A0A1A6A8Y8_9TREE|nr:uncharacterized protein I303_02533 [Kwoniella dejecticola CBS 10117]OBR86525.1 hypothetical protein I303_02533 [Kwoniella dejecticola CBS 10117]